MYDKTGKIVDRREMLRVKLKSLAAEAKIIRREEKRSHGALREELYRHRIDVVRAVSRNTHIAYGLIKGRTLDQMEPTRKSEPDWDAVAKMISKYGPREYTLDVLGSLIKSMGRLQKLNVQIEEALAA